MRRTPVVQIDFGDGIEPREVFARYEAVISDRGSRYAVCVGRVKNRQDIENFLAEVKSEKRFKKATHNSWAARVSRDGAIYETKADDGEVGAGQVILRVLQKRGVINGAVCVTRWFGGIKLQNDRFAHVQNAAVLGVERGCGDKL